MLVVRKLTHLEARQAAKRALFKMKPTFPHPKPINSLSIKQKEKYIFVSGDRLQNENYNLSLLFVNKGGTLTEISYFPSWDHPRRRRNLSATCTE